jgi:hypothetical protein
MTPCQSCDNDQNIGGFCSTCYTLISKKTVRLLPGVINVLEITNPNYFDPSYIMEVTHHVSDQPWCIVNKFHFFDSEKNAIILHIITSEASTIHEGEDICHYRFVSAPFIFEEIGKKIQKNTIFTVYHLYFFNLSANTS